MYRKFTAICVLFLFCFFGSISSAQDSDSDFICDSIKDSNGLFYKYGFLDMAGNVRIPYIYDYAEPFSCGYALVRRGDRLFFIDSQNRPAFGSDKSNYQFYFSFCEGLCVVEKDGKYGYLDTDGNLAIGLLFDEAYSFSEGLAAVKIDGKFGYIDKSGNVVIDLQYTDAAEFQNGYAAIAIDGRYGFIDTAGEQRTPVIYEAVLPFSEGLARVRLNGKYMFIDVNGFPYFPPVFEQASAFLDGTALVKLGGKYGYIRKDGSFAIALKYDFLSGFNGDYAIAGRYVGEGVLWYGLIDRHGNRVCPFSYDKITFEDGQYALTKNGRTVFLDDSLQPVGAE